MKVLLDIQDEKADDLLEVLKELPFVKATLISKEKGTLIKDIKKAIDNLNLVRSPRQTNCPAC